MQEQQVQQIRGPYIDDKGCRWDTNNADYTGWLYKRSKWLREMRKRFFILKGSKLFYAKDEYACPHGVIDLIDCIDVKPSENGKDKYVVTLELRDNSESLCAANLEEQNVWICKLGHTVARHSCIHVSASTTRLHSSEI